MKTISYFLVATAICLSVFSCKKDKEKDPSEYSFAKETVDKGKTNLEDAGQKLITEMKGLENAEAGNVLQSLENCNSISDVLGSSASKTTPVFRTITAASTVTKGQNSLSYLSKLMKADVTADPNTFQEVYDKYKGIYTWDSSKEVWGKTVSAEFKFIFPSKKGGTTNDATLVITYTGKTGLTPLDNYKGDLPATFNASIIVNTKKVFEIDFKASYNGDGLPTSVNYFIALYPYKYEIIWNYSSSNIELRYHLTNGTTNILDCFGGIGGNFALNNVTSATNPEQVFTNGNAYFQVFNIKLAGNIDFKSLAAAETKINESGVNDFKADTAYAAEINKYIALNLVYADSKQKIASVEAYPIKNTYTYTAWENGKYVVKEKSESDISIRLIFGDSTKGDLESYFSKGFSDLVNDLNTFIVELNTDYDLGIDPVEYKK